MRVPRVRVLKFGGAALRDGPAVGHAARIVRDFGGENPLVVVSAHEGVTAQLERSVDEALEGRLDWDPLRIRHRTLLRQLELPGDLLDRHLSELRAILETLRTSPDPDPRFRDFVLSFGERMSARVFAAALRREGMEATPLDATDLGLVKAVGTRGLPEKAPDAVVHALRRVSGVPVVTGFLALDGEGYLTTLGRNGSDLTAAWFGAALRAEEIQLWKRVPGLMTADPRLVPRARHLPRLSWDEAGELARHGSGVLHPDSIEPAQRARTTIHLRDLENAAGPGSRITDEEPTAHPGVTAIAHRTGVASLRIPFADDSGRSSQLEDLFGALTAAGIDPYAGVIGPDAVELLLTEGRSLTQAARARFPQGLLVPELATVTVIGRGLDEHAETQAAIDEASKLGAREVRCELTSGATERRSRVLLSSRAAVEGLVQRLHTRFFEN